MMRQIVQELNKSTLAKATGISYSGLRKYASGVVKDLTPEEKQSIYLYLLDIANLFKQEDLFL